MTAQYIAVVVLIIVSGVAACSPHVCRASARWLFSAACRAVGLMLAHADALEAYRRALRFARRWHTEELGG